MNKKKSIVVLSLVAVFIILMTVFAVVEFPSGLYDYTGYAKTIKLGLDLSGGVAAEYKVTDVPNGDPETFNQRAEGTVNALQTLLVSKGYTEAVVSYANQKIRVEVPDVDDPEKLFDLIGRPQTLEFRSEPTESETNKTLIVGRTDIENAYVTQDQNSANYFAVGLKFNSEGAKKFAQVTQEYKGKKLYIWIGGECKQEHQSGITINEVISGGSAVITGNYSYENAYAVATQIQSGTFTVNLDLIENRTVSATLGANAVKMALIAGAVGVAIIFLFMAGVYRMMGVAADIALTIYILILLWLCAVLPWVQLTLPGIAGVLLGIGMAVDANVVVFERIKDEFAKTNKPIKSAVGVGYKRALSAVLDGNITTIIGAVILWIVGTASIQGFAIVLFISIIVSMFTSLAVTRLIMNCMLSFNKTNEKLYGLKRKNQEIKDENNENFVENELKEEV